MSPASGKRQGQKRAAKRAARPSSIAPSSTNGDQPGQQLDGRNTAAKLKKVRDYEDDPPDWIEWDEVVEASKKG